MKKSKKELDREIVETFYGINPETFEVDSVSLTRGGTLSKWGKGGTYATHPILHGRQPQAEIVIVWGLTNIFSEHPVYHNVEHTKRKIEELKGIAAKMKRGENERDLIVRALTL